MKQIEKKREALLQNRAAAPNQTDNADTLQTKN